MSRLSARMPAFCASLCLSAMLASAAPLDIGHSVYPFLRRLELEGRIPPGRLNALPITKAEAAALLEHAAHAADSKQAAQAAGAEQTAPAAGSRKAAEMPAWERRRLDAYREEFGLIPGNDGPFHPIGFHESSFTVDLSAQSYNAGFIADSLPKARTYGFGTLTAQAEGRYGDRLHFLTQVNAGQERSLHPRFVENYDPARGQPYNTDRTGKAGIPRGTATFDAFRAVIGYESPALRLEFGSDWNQWGPGIRQHAMVSRMPWFWVQDSLRPNDSAGFRNRDASWGYRDGYRRPGEAAPMTQARLSARAGAFTYTKIVAQRTGLWTDSSAYLVAHRLEWRPLDRLGVAVSEMVAVGGRSLDWLYAIPLAPLKYAEHDLGDRDNTGVGLDFDLLLPYRARVFGELFLDDWSGWDLGFWGNKFAFSLGGEMAGLVHSGSRVQVEYARVEPWVSTHRKPGRQLIHYGALIGSSLPPDSHAFWAAWEQALGAFAAGRLDYAFMQRNAVDRGTSPFDWHDDAVDGRTKRFLDGTVETRHSVAAGGAMRWRRFVEFKGELGWMWVENWKSRPGASLSSPILSGELALRY